jgi:hypothetical protein
MAMLWRSEVRTEKRKAISIFEEEERDFFQHELGNMGWGFANLAVGEDVALGEEAPGANGTGDEQWEQGGL